jgi:hypothetical protein
VPYSLSPVLRGEGGERGRVLLESCTVRFAVPCSIGESNGH